LPDETPTENLVDLAKPEETGAPPTELAQNRDSTQNLIQKQGNESPTIVTSAAMFPEEIIDEEQVEDQNPDEQKLVIVSDNDDLAQEIVENESEVRRLKSFISDFTLLF
jgi:hypothetical protein